MAVSVSTRLAVICLVGMSGACGGTERPTATATSLTPAPVEDRAGRVKLLLDSSRALAAHGMWPQAEVDLRKALELSYGFKAPWPEYRADGLAQLARAVVAQRRYSEGRGYADQALGSLQAGKLADDQRLYALERTRADAFRGEEQGSSVAVALGAAIAAAERHPTEMSAQLVDASLALAEHLQTTGQGLQAAKTLERALSVTKASSQRSLGARVAEPLAAQYDASGDRKRAQELRTEYGLSAPAPSATGSATETVRGIAAMQADFRACYQAALEHEGVVEGGVKLVIRIGADGRVADVKAAGLKLPRSTVDCLLERAALARFDPPKGGSATITVPVTFVKQD